VTNRAVPGFLEGRPGVPGRKRVFVYLELEKTLLISTNMSFLTFLLLIAERYITSSQRIKAAIFSG